MRRRVAAWIILVVGLGLVVAPEAFGMWSRAPRGAQMINGFSTIMTARNVPVLASDGRTILGGFGSSPQVVQAAATHFSGGRVHPSYSEAAGFIESRSDLGGLAYLQRQLPTLGPPFSTLLSVFYQDQPYFAGMVGLPPFGLFPLFFVIPGLIIAVAALAFLRRDGTELDSARRPVPARKPARVLAVVGALLCLAPLAPMPPGFHSIRTVGPHGATLLADFASPVNGTSSQAVMSLATVHQFDRYVSEMRAGSSELLKAVVDASAYYGHRSISATQAAGFLASDPALVLADRLSTSFTPMYSLFRHILSTMARDFKDYQAVQALPSFRLFPWFFAIPGVMVLGLSLLGLMTGTPGPAIAARREEEEASAGDSGLVRPGR